MVVVAVAGGQGDLGQQICKAIQATGKYELIDSLSKPLVGFQVVEVDYDSIKSLTQTLVDHDVHTIISALAVHWESASTNQLNLIKAAAESRVVKRFMPSEFSGNYTLPHEFVVLFPYSPQILQQNMETFYSCSLHNRPKPRNLPMPGAAEFVKNQQLLASTKLEYTIVMTGMFMDYFGMPNQTTPMRGLYHIIDVPNGRGLLPGTGMTKAVYTMTSDIAVYVAAALALEKWERVYHLVGDIISPVEVIAAAERVTGKKFHVTEDSMETMLQGTMTILPPNEELLKAWPDAREETIKVMALINVGLERGAFNVSQYGASLNDALPHLRTMKTEEYLIYAFKEAR
ncbi:hypothetical protein BP6252_00007 [Coleophoma cylindrospora]|uniref:NmrA-like domain-containing protein n=1 Tax=Coleophoma cylindrospora TaxID=1849047 RepID=A0A3D8SNS9_9HELO|nr:hypothetical protein BP6252_00007 [Coleophoma cylindrospora]